MLTFISFYKQLESKLHKFLTEIFVIRLLCRASML